LDRDLADIHIGLDTARFFDGQVALQADTALHAALDDQILLA